MMDLSSSDPEGERGTKQNMYRGHTRFDGFHIKEGGITERGRQGLDINKQS